MKQPAIFVVSPELKRALEQLGEKNVNVLLTDKVRHLIQNYQEGKDFIYTSSWGGTQC